VAGGPENDPVGARGTTRLDKWLWHGRFFKTRSLATREVLAGHVRINSVKVSKPAQPVGAGDTLTFAQGDRIRVIRLVAIGSRRGPADEARALYEDLAPLPPPGSDAGPRPDAPAPGFDGTKFGGSGRPSKKDRRTYDQSRNPQSE